MKKIFVVVVMLCFQIAFSQETCTYRAMVVDSLDLPVYDASITAFNEKNQSAGYTFSDNEGEFKLEMPCNAKYELEIEHVSYKSKVVKVNLDKSKREKIVMKYDVVDLKEVVAKGRIPIQVKGDTIEYDALSFSTGNEEELEDLLKKLPGITVEKGKVYYQGKEMKSIKVEGREIFGGNQKLLTKNLPSDAVSKIQLNKKFKANPFANSIQQDEEFELNIVLKEDKKNLIFGNVTIGGDAHKHTDLQEKLFYFSRKVDATLIGDYNTYGKQVFTWEDYFTFLGGMSEFVSEGGNSALRNPMGTVGFNSDNNASKMNNFLGAGNLGYQPNKNLTISGFAMATSNGVNYKSSSQRIYPTFEQKDDNVNDQDIFAFISRLNMEYITKNNAQIKYKVNFNKQNSEDRTAITSYLDKSEKPSGFRNLQQKRDNTTINQKFTYIKKIGDDDNFGLYLSHIYQKETPDILFNSNNQPFSNLLNLTEKNNEFQLKQNQQLTFNTFQLLSIYNHLLSNVSNLRLKAGMNYTSQSLENKLWDFDMPVNEKGVLNKADFNFQEYYTEATYTRKIGKLKADVGLSVNYFSSNNNAFSYKENRLSQLKWLPHVNLSYEFSLSRSLKFSYATSYEVPNVKDWTRGYDIQSYFNIYSGNPNLKPLSKQDFSLTYRYFNYFKFLSFWASVGYSKTENNIRNKGINDGQNQFSTPFNATIPDNSYRANLNFSKRFSKLYELKLRASGNKGDYQSYANNKEYKVNSLNHSYNLENVFKWRKKVEISLGLNSSFSQFESGLRNNKFTNLKPYVDFAYVISPKILLEADYSYNNQWQNREFINKNQELNASIRVKPAKKTYIKLIVGNILNNDQIVSSGFNDFYTYINTKQTLGRYFIMQLRYKF